MIIDIPDSVSGEERKRLLKLLPLQYALERHSTKKGAADFLGITDRAVRLAVHRHPELKKYVHTAHRLKTAPGPGRDKYVRMKRLYPDEC